MAPSWQVEVLHNQIQYCPTLSCTVLFCPVLQLYRRPYLWLHWQSSPRGHNFFCRAEDAYATHSPSNNRDQLASLRLQALGQMAWLQAMPFRCHSAYTCACSCCPHLLLQDLQRAFTACICPHCCWCACAHSTIYGPPATVLCDFHQAGMSVSVTLIATDATVLE
jgi:hypothetical protein